MVSKKHRNESPHSRGKRRSRLSWVERRIRQEFRVCPKARRLEFIRTWRDVRKNLRSVSSARLREYQRFMFWIGLLRPLRVGPRGFLHPLAQEMREYNDPRILRNAGWSTLPGVFVEMVPGIVRAMFDTDDDVDVDPGPKDGDEG